MALRNIVKKGDDVLTKMCRPVEKFDEKLCMLLDDMYETMEDANGVGLAAPQVGLLRRIVVIDVGEGRIELINPEIITEICEKLGLDFDTVSEAFAPYCTRVEEITTAESFSDLES